MSQPITEDDVRQVAKLSRLALSDDDIKHFTGQLAAVLDYVGKLNELDVEGVEPLFHPSDHHSVTREDIEQPGLAPDDALANAPARQDNFFKVPKVLGDGGGA
ncbi:Asp-tRNA(Asn)/Glu-tRNA(Gln) amidotransferase subunit GatC [Algisphaera agarilytica]|uniref:Aspartyl/glutamyl-tRNA(Asn/Gln) amidotransferase subunit C n=1 Tax=Algisphaera agarilytica TaxID=1385975 RepID=A0A7X0H3Q2_9BACT|nr:Asp-tRNA(Asn)/Glu-tRNA(Gln) amidotransferase subunit GatC [Algisphaera agarilytica]MBB6428497.1 aspartyl-tRNA(Asn)/glutamyl-tRNA(Gln) amidotransferase subunit C [Algisphaera agarilytica]